jgi:hypothetical protein
MANASTISRTPRIAIGRFLTVQTQSSMRRIAGPEIQPGLLGELAHAGRVNQWPALINVSTDPNNHLNRNRTAL